MMRLNESDLLYNASELELVLSERSMEIPYRGYHTVYEISCWADAKKYTISYIIGGTYDGCRYTVVIGFDDEGTPDVVGWNRGFKLPVPIRPKCSLFEPNILRSIRRAKALPLLTIDEVPGFIHSSTGHHKDGWYTKSKFVYKVDPGHCARWAGEAQFYKLSEGIYTVFEDSTYRLIPARDFFECDLPDYVPDKRQGDLLIWKMSFVMAKKEVGPNSNVFHIESHRISVEEGKNIIVKEDYDGRLWFPAGQGSLKVSHPEHDEIILPDNTYLIALAPGTSRPFQSGDRD